MVRAIQTVPWGDVAQWCEMVCYFKKSCIRSIQTSPREVAQDAGYDASALLENDLLYRNVCFTFPFAIFLNLYLIKEESLKRASNRRRQLLYVRLNRSFRSSLFFMWSVQKANYFHQQLLLYGYFPTVLYSIKACVCVYLSALFFNSF